MKIKKINRFSDRVFKSVLKLLPQLAPGSELPSAEKFRSILKSENTHFFVAELNNNVIAGILTLVTYDIFTGTKFWIEDVIVDESHRGKGIGKALILFAIEHARSKGAKSVDLTSRPSRIAANQLYRQIGFVKRKTNVYRYTFNLINS